MNIINKIDYNTLKKIKKNSFNLCFASMALSFSPNNYIKISALMLELLSVISTFSLSDNNIFMNTKDMLEINKLYNEFLKNYVKLQNSFSFIHPTEIFTMFNYAYSYGFLSKEHKFIYSKENLVDIRPLYNLDIINGRGVCRHLSKMLKDIYDESNLENYILTTYMPEYKIDYTKTDDPKYDINKLYKMIDDLNIGKNEKNEIFNLIEDNEGKLNFNITEKRKKANIGNHVINIVKNNDKLYFYDPTNIEILNYIGNNTLQYDDKLKTNIILNTKVNINNFKKKDYTEFKNNVTTYLNELEQSNSFANMVIFNNAISICKENKDMFEKFYNENNQIYSEISNKILKLKK